MTLFILFIVSILWGLAILIRERPAPFPRRRRRKWMLNLKVGDIVCDCRYKHSEVVSIDHVYSYPWKWITFITGRIPGKVGDQIFELSKAVCQQFGFTSIEDKRITVEDGHTFDLLSCCDPFHDHDQQSHEEPAQAEKEEDRKCSS